MVAPLIPIGGAGYNAATGEIYVDGAVAAALTGQENRVLELLLRCRGEPMAAERAFGLLYEHRLDQPSGGADLIRVYICSLRRKLLAAGICGAIRTRHGYGWILRNEAELIARVRPAR